VISDSEMPCDCCGAKTGESQLTDNMFLCPMCIKRPLEERFEMMLRFEQKLVEEGDSDG
jgi:hypothetical protein